MRSARVLPWLTALVAPIVAHAAPVASVFGGRVPCAVVGQVQFCQGSVATRVESFDGVPLDVNVTLPPAAMDGPFPLIVDLHGWSLGKTDAPYVAWATAGYVVLSFSARGFHGSCGLPASRAPDPSLSNPNACLERGWTRLADVRYEAHDTQHLAGLLVDDGLVLPTKIGATGGSYGGGQSMILAALKDRVMQPDGSFVPWTSPGGTPMRIAAAAPLIPWSDLAYALTPNGRTLDYRSENPYGPRAGVQKQSYIAVLYGSALATGFYAPPNTDFASDVPRWNARVAAGEPYDGDSTVGAIIDEITTHHSAYYVDDSVEPAPLFIYNAWTDDLFPADEALRYATKTKAKYPNAEITLYFADQFGHPRAALGFTGATAIEKVTTFFARHLQGGGDPLPPLETLTQACNGASVEGAFTASDWDALHPGEVRWATRKTQRFDQGGGKPENAAATDPFNGGPCRTVAADDDPKAATYRLPAAKGDGYTLLGSPTVVADVAATGSNAQIAARLWDVAPNGMQTLVSQSLYRPRTDNRGPQVFQLHPNGWRFAGGHVPKLELLGQSAPYGRPSNGSFTIAVSSLTLRLPRR
jgi:predicted acyl esterase